MGKDTNVLNADFFREYPVISSGKGIYMYDENGVEYIDGASGPILCSLGHGLTEMGDVLKEQAGKLAFAHRDDCVTPILRESCTKVCEATNGDMEKVFFVCGGSEANEIAIKLVREYHLDRGHSGKYKMISRWQSYHGSSMGVLSISGFTKRRTGFEPYLSEFGHIPPAYCYRCWFGREAGKCNLECAQALENEILCQGPETVAAFIAEPISGMSLCGAEPPVGYFKKIREICDKYDVAMIMDEVMTGVGRTGKNFAYMHSGIVPDLVSMGKAVGGGYFPLGAVACTAKFYNEMYQNKGSFPPGYSWSGNPLGAAVSVKTFEYLAEHNLVDHVAKMGEYLKAKMQALSYHPTVGDVRGRGLMIGMEFVTDKETKEPFDPKVKLSLQLNREALKRHMLIESSSGCNRGQSGDQIMIGPAFIITKEQIDTIVDRLDQVITTVEKNNGF